MASGGGRYTRGVPLVTPIPTLTDQLPPGGWTNPSSGEEVADECAWITSGQGAAANVTMASGIFAMQSIWSNDNDPCEISHTRCAERAPRACGGRQVMRISAALSAPT